MLRGGGIGGHSFNLCSVAHCSPTTDPSLVDVAVFSWHLKAQIGRSCHAWSDEKGFAHKIVATLLLWKQWSPISCVHGLIVDGACCGS